MRQSMKVNLNVRVEDLEMEKLKRYSDKTGRTKTDLIREFIRSLPV